MALFVNEICLRLPKYWSPSAWTKHVPFAFWIVDALKPRVYVELGVHYGMSYFAACQIVAEKQLGTRCYAVDTWSGDEHSGFYSDEVFRQVYEHNLRNYSDFSSLLRMRFDQALDHIPDGSIDLLHVDGRHFYDDVKADFESWIPKLSERAVVMFHDTEVRERDFGVWKLWSELENRFPSFNFLHGHGLGLIAFGPKIDPSLTEFFAMSASPEAITSFRHIFMSCGKNLSDQWERRVQRAADEQRLAALQAELEKRQGEFAALQGQLERRQGEFAALQGELERRQGEFAARQGELSAEQGNRSELTALVADLRAQLARARGKPLRVVGDYIHYRLLRRILKLGLPLSAKTAARFANSAAKRNPQRSLLSISQLAATPHAEGDSSPSVPFRVIPRYIDPVDTWRAPLTHSASRIAVHLHLFYFDLLDSFIARFQSIPFAFDLFVSIPDFAPIAQAVNIERVLREGLQPRAQKIVVKPVPNRGRDIAPLIAEFGKTLLGYDIIGHFHTKKSPHNPQLECWRDTMLDLLLGPSGNPGGHVARIVDMLETNAKIVYAEGSAFIPKDATGWAGNYAMARDILDKHSAFSIADFPIVEFPEGAMLWAKSAALRNFLEMPLSYQDFAPEPIPADGTLAHALERLVFILAQEIEGDLIRLHKGDSVPDYSFFEETQDFSDRLNHTDVKILAYYLPQFHPIPENDEWHGAGFTEWTKVRAANPLFRGHFQQHIPHPDIGYYLIDDGAVLRRQAADMRSAGVYGQIFYHYWFGGKLILERPAQMLLENADIDMPFSFCWANENWTRRWDGSEDQILLKQDYSADDARSFIRYLIPFFLDARYIKVDGRPVVFVYRPTSIPIMSTYLEIWRKECEAAGLERPYVVATLAAGARDPRDFAMDAGAERVLYDWTDGKVPDMTSDVEPYTPLKGRVFSYERMKEHYTAQPIETAFTCFRSLVPNWDNTARYGAGAHLLHGSTPPLFQEWLEFLIAQTKQALPPDRRFILVNAWNEWAEGTHLEADTRYGYAYLNSIGRALSNEPYRKPAHDSRRALHIAQMADRTRDAGAIMMFVHRWGGGTERHVNDMVAALALKNVVVFLTRVDVASPNRVVVETAGVEDRLCLGAFDIDASPDDYAWLMRRLHVRHLHVQHLAGFPEATAEWLQRACATADVPYDISLHDYMVVCPRIVMVTESNSYCGEPPLSRCEACIATSGSPFGDRPSTTGVRVLGDCWLARAVASSQARTPGNGFPDTSRGSTLPSARIPSRGAMTRD